MLTYHTRKVISIMIHTYLFKISLFTYKLFKLFKLDVSQTRNQHISILYVNLVLGLLRRIQLYYFFCELQQIVSSLQHTSGEKPVCLLY